MHPKIFVQIASYRDPECQWTVKDLFEKADHPERVFVGICWQFDMTNDTKCFDVPSPVPQNTIILMVDASRSRGVCWARHQAQKLYDGEDYVLMIDSHMRFVKGWDSAMIKELKRCPSAKPLLSTYPPGYTPPNKLASNPLPTFMHAKQFDERGDLRFKASSLKKKPDQPLRGAFMAAGFIFTQAAFLQQVPYDPYLYFANEEATMAARAFTHGWDVFAPSTPLLYHYYHVHGKGQEKVLHWDDHADWVRLTKLSRARTNYMLAGEAPPPAIAKEALKEIEQYGLGTERPLSAFENYTGLDFKKRKASEKALTGGFIRDLAQWDPVT